VGIDLNDLVIENSNISLNGDLLSNYGIVDTSGATALVSSIFALFMAYNRDDKIFDLYHRVKEFLTSRGCVINIGRNNGIVN